MTTALPTLLSGKYTFETEGRCEGNRSRNWRILHGLGLPASLLIDGRLFSFIIQMHTKNIHMKAFEVLTVTHLYISNFVYVDVLHRNKVLIWVTKPYNLIHQIFIIFLFRATDATPEGNILQKGRVRLLILKHSLTNGKKKFLMTLKSIPVIIYVLSRYT